MAKVIPIGQPVNESERQAIGFLRNHLPEGWLIFHNFEMRKAQEVFEIDIAILAPHAVYLVDVKGTRGNIDMYGSKWYPEGRQPFFSPLAKLRSHAKTMATIIRESNTGQIELRKAHVHAAVLLTADNAAIFDHNPSHIQDKPDVTDFNHCLKYFRDKSRIPSNRLNNIARFHKQIAQAIQGKAKPKSAALVFRDWQVEEKLGGTDRYTEYRAKHNLLGKSGGMTRLRVYQTDPYQDEVVRKAEFKKISNAYRAVAHMPTHANVLAVKDLFVTDDEEKVVLVTEDIPGQALRLHINKASLALTFDQKLQVMRDVLSALDHAHRHEVIHRNLTPDAILVTKGGQVRVTGFDFARVGKHRSTDSTIAGEIVEDLDITYRAPELVKSEKESFPKEATIASDLYSVGLIYYELLAGELPFENIDEMMEADGRFPMKPSEHKPNLPKGFDEWLQTFCEFDPEERHTSAAIARKALEDLILPEGQKDAITGESGPDGVLPSLPDNLTDLPQDFILADRFRIQSKLGSGGFGVAYKVFDSLGDVVRVIKLVTKDRRSVYERLRREYKTLANLPEHPNVVKVIWADRMADAKQTPYIVFEYVEGMDISDLIDAEALSLEDSVRIVRESAEGLDHLHAHGVYHQDMKPSNLLWTDKGVRIIDFNVAVSENDDVKGGGGTRRYLPPDYDFSVEPNAADRIDRDLYGLGVSFYECLTGKYPFDEPAPPIRVQPKDPKQFKHCADISVALVNVLVKMIAPERKDRFASASEFLTALNEVKRLRALLTTGEIVAGPKVVPKLGFEPTQPNTNPFVTHLLTLYSQSQVSNAGTRGLDEIGKATYVPTYLDEKLKPAMLKGEFRLVIISGNAGDGKTAFIQQFESFAENKGAQMQRGANGAVFQLKGHTFQSNYDGSQDEGDERNDAVLQKFFGPFAGKEPSGWPKNQTRLIAINEGRLVDFFLEHEDSFPLLAKQIQQGLAGTALENGISVVNLNLRSVVAEPETDQPSILQRLITRMSQQEYWKACEKCDLAGKCYVYHNAQTFQDPIAGPKVIERLKMLYTITHLRGRLHITMRDLRSALAFMLVGTRDCDSIHQLYQNGGEENQNRILDGFYFNSWLGGSEGSNDRLIALFREIDIAKVSNPDLDRELGFLAPKTKDRRRFSFANRAGYDDALVDTRFRNLPRDYTLKHRALMIDKHRTYVSHVRRRHFFERRDIGWKEMLPYQSIEPFLNAIKDPGTKSVDEVADILQAINRGDGLSDPARLGNQLALRVRQVDKGTIHSYRLFDGERFILSTDQETADHPFLECLSQALVLSYDSGDGHKASLRINLDIYEMLLRLNNGYRPSIEEQEGFYLSLSVFKNVLSAAPYQEVLLTETGHRFYEIGRSGSGVLDMKVSEKELNTVAIKGRDKEFRAPKVSYLEFKHTEMDRVLTMLFPRLKYDGYASRRPPRGGDLTVEEFMEDFLEHPEWFSGFDQHPDVLRKWIETDLMDVVNRGKANQAIAAPRPLHGNTYKFRNAKHSRDYGAAEQIYWMLFYARKGKGQAVRDALKRFFFQGIDLVTDRYDSNATVDVETQAILRLDHQVTQDMKDSKEPSRFQPLCNGQADIMADDTLRLLAYEPYIPRSVLVDYLKTLMAFHLAIYHLKLLQMLPKLVKQHAGNELCSTKDCPIDPGLDNALEGCPYKVALVVDMGDVNNPHITELARKSTDRLYRQIPSFVQANFVVKKLDEMAEYLSKKTGKLATPAKGVFSVGDLVSLLRPEYDADRQAYFKFRLASLIEESTAGKEDVDPEIRDVMAMGLGEFESFIEILMAYRGKYHRQYITECLDSLLLKNKDSGLLAQPRSKGSPRRFVLGSKLLEVLLQIAVLTQDGARFVTREIRIEDLLAFLRNRYGLHIDRLPENGQSNSSILDRRALRLNLEAFKRRLREIGFYEDLSDAYVTQKVSPRYKIERYGQTDKNEGHG